VISSSTLFVAQLLNFLLFSLIEVRNVALARTVIGMTGVEDQQRKRAMIESVNPTDAEVTEQLTVITRLRMIVGLKEYVLTTSPLNSVTYSNLVW